MGTYRSWVFKTPHDPATNHRDDACTLVEVSLASSAAPLYRSLSVLDHEPTKTYNMFADGGLWANNPVLVTLTEALHMTANTDEEIEIFSLGSCGKPEGEIIPREKRHRGLKEWKFGGGAAAVSIAAQEFAFDMIAKFLCPHLKKSVRIIRFPAAKIPGAMLQYLRPEALTACSSHGKFAPVPHPRSTTVSPGKHSVPLRHADDKESASELGAAPRVPGSFFSGFRIVSHRRFPQVFHPPQPPSTRTHHLALDPIRLSARKGRNQRRRVFRVAP